jgi:hypothetical protein
LATTAECPPSGEFSGLAAYDVLGAPTQTAPNTSAGWVFDAPEGTYVTALDLYRYLGKRFSASWEVSGATEPEGVFDTCSFDPSVEEGCFVGYPEANGAARRVLVGLRSSRVVISVRCPASEPSCGNGATLHHAWAVLYGARVTLRDDSEPVVAPFDIGNSGWRRGSEDVSISARDNSGIRSVGVATARGMTLGSTSPGCDYTLSIPCRDGDDLQLAVQLTRLPDGPHELRATATDAAGNVARSEPRTIYVDNNAPGGPLGLQVVGGDGWRSSNAFDVSWANPAQAPGSPIARVRYRLCRSDGACEAEQAVDGAATTLSGISVPQEGQWVLRVWLEDVAGNVSEANAAKVPLRFGRDPLVAARLAPAVRVASVSRRGRRLIVRGRARPGATGTVVVRVRRAARGRYRPRVARRARVANGRFTARVRAPRALRRRSTRLRVSASYAGDMRHAAGATVRIFRLRRR